MTQGEFSILTRIIRVDWKRENMNSRQCFPDDVYWGAEMSRQITANSLKGDYIDDLIYFNSSFFHDILKLVLQYIMEALLLSGVGWKIINSHGLQSLFYMNRPYWLQIKLYKKAKLHYLCLHINKILVCQILFRK